MSDGEYERGKMWKDGYEAGYVAGVRAAAQAGTAPAKTLREAANEVLKRWDYGEVRAMNNRASCAFTELRAALAVGANDITMPAHQHGPLATATATASRQRPPLIIDDEACGGAPAAPAPERKAALEEAARLCEGIAEHNDGQMEWNVRSLMAAAAKRIRALEAAPGRAPAPELEESNLEWWLNQVRLGASFANVSLNSGGIDK